MRHGGISREVITAIAADDRIIVSPENHRNPLTGCYAPEINVARRNWKEAAVSASEYLLLHPDKTTLMFDGLVSGPYSPDLLVHCPPEDFQLFAPKNATEGDGRAAKVHWKSINGSHQWNRGLWSNIRSKKSISRHISCFPVYSTSGRVMRSDPSWIRRQGLPVACNRRTDLRFSNNARKAIPDEDAIAADLQSGWNALLVRVANETRDFALYLRLSNSSADLARLTNLGP